MGCECKERVEARGHGRGGRRTGEEDEEEQPRGLPAPHPWACAPSLSAQLGYSHSFLI